MVKKSEGFEVIDEGIGALKEKLSGLINSETPATSKNLSDMQ